MQYLSIVVFAVFAVFAAFAALKAGFALWNGETSFGHGRTWKRASVPYWLLIAAYVFLMLMSATLVVEWTWNPDTMARRN